MSLVDALKDFPNCPRRLPCEHCGFLTAPGFAKDWRVRCHADPCDGGGKHLLCVDCAMALGEPTRTWPLWADMEACPDEAAMAYTLAGKDLELMAGLGWVYTVMQNYHHSDRLLTQVRALGVPLAVKPLLTGPGGKIAVVLRDGNEVWYPSPPRDRSRVAPTHHR